MSREEYLTIFNRPSTYYRPVSFLGQPAFALYDGRDGTRIVVADTITNLWTAMINHDIQRPETVH